MDKLIISGEGFPGTNELLKFQHDTPVKPLEGIVKYFGDGIVSGMEPAAGNKITDGWIVLDGELLPFVGGTKTAKIVLIEQVTEAGYDTNGTGDFSNIQPVWKKRFCQFGTLATPGAVAEYPWIIFNRLPKLQDLQDLAATGLRLLKKGTIGINANQKNDKEAGSTTAMIDFVSVTRLPLASELQYRIDFNSPLTTFDYFPLIRLEANFQQEPASLEVLLVSRSFDSMTIELVPAYWIGGTDPFSVQMIIDLIGTNK